MQTWHAMVRGERGGATQAHRGRRQHRKTNVRHVGMQLALKGRHHALGGLARVAEDVVLVHVKVGLAGLASVKLGVRKRAAAVVSAAALPQKPAALHRAEHRQRTLGTVVTTMRISRTLRSGRGWRSLDTKRRWK